MVPWTCLTPFSTATMVLATASSQSLWQWIPSGTFNSALARATAAPISPGNPPPLVSHRTIQSAPPSLAASRHSIANSGLLRYPSKKCSASKTTSSTRVFM